jgi:ADP-heptose:LPS heptosyltransferase
LSGHPFLDEVITIPKGWLGKPRVAWELRQQLKARQFDVTIDPQSLTKSSALAWLSGAPRRIGFTPPRSRELAPWLNNTRLPAQRSHVVDHQLDLLEALGITDRSVEFCLPEDKATGCQIEAYLCEAVPSGRFATINPGAGWESRIWPAQRFGEVAAYLARGHSLPTLVVWGENRERSWAEEIVRHSGGRASLAPPTSLKELAAILRRTCVFVASDTGPTHLAAAVGASCVTLFGTTRPEVSGPYGNQHILVSSPGPVTDSRHRRRASNDAMRRIDVATVCAACDLVLARKSKAA